jgi:hypothetical protein
MKKILFEKLTVKETAAIRGGDDTTVTAQTCSGPGENPKGDDCSATPVGTITIEEDCQCPAVPEVECAKR